MSRGAFREILGQPQVVATLLSSMTSGRVHHAWIFHGPAGVGKFTAAMCFARALLTSGLEIGAGAVALPNAMTDVDANGSAFTHPDLHIITKELARYSDDASVRSRKLISIPKEVIATHLLAPAALAPTVSADTLAKKIFIVDEAELLNAVSQNALLKTLEEPASGTVIILVTSSEDRLLPTIRSRSQRLAFGALDAESMDSWLNASGVEISPDESAWLVEHSRGSPGLFVLAHEAGMAQWSQRLEPMLNAAERGEYDTELGGALAECVDEWANWWVERHKAENPSKDAANKAGVRHVLDLLAERARRQVWRECEDEHASNRAMRTIDLLYETEQNIASNVNLKLAMENLAVQMARE
jgi:DNA polymerase III subunit delta'